MSICEQRRYLYTFYRNILIFGLLCNPARSAAVSVTASSEEKTEAQAINMIDGDINTRWSSIFDDKQWVMIDIGEIRDIKGIEIYWEAAYTKKYKVLVSVDEKKWQSVYNTTSGSGGMTDIEFPSQKARYIKLNLIERGTEWGNSIYEVILKGITDFKNTEADPELRMAFGLIKEDPLVLEWLKQQQDIGTPDKQLVPSMEGGQLSTFNNAMVAMAFLVK